MADKKPRPLKMGVSNTKKVTVKMPSELKRKLPTQILSDGYNMREKSKWVVEAIRSLLDQENWEGALLSEILVKPDTQDVFSIPSELVSEMNREANRVSMQKPNLKANQSTIVRTAINRRLLGFFTKVE